MTTALSKVAALVQQASGIQLGERQYPFLQAALDRMGTEFAPEVFLQRAADPLQRTRVLEQLIEEVTVKETSFLRDRGQLTSIDWKLLLENARARGSEQVRVWTAPCATGEEAYSLALLACEAFTPALPPVSILATDISVGALAHARRGVYGSRSVSAVSAALRTRYFRSQPEGLAVGDRLRPLVTFAVHNLITHPFPPVGHAPFDLILCRNVLIYFDNETVGRVLDSFQHALAPSGELVLGATDVLCANASRLAQGSPLTPLAMARAREPQRRLRRPLGRAPLVDQPDDEEEGDDSPDAAAYFRLGLAQLENDDPAAAVSSLRRALFVEPHFGLAAFKLGGAHQALGDLPAARRAYEQALRSLEPDERHEPYLAQIDLADVATAIRARLDAMPATDALRRQAAARG